jgi:hypothetical protein
MVALKFLNFRLCVYYPSCQALINRFWMPFLKVLLGTYAHMCDHLTLKRP